MSLKNGILFEDLPAMERQAILAHLQKENFVEAKKLYEEFCHRHINEKDSKQIRTVDNPLA